jgi:DNA-binding beta-propeller fold protein YncE
MLRPYAAALLASLVTAASSAAAHAPQIRVGAQPLDVIAAGGTLWTENYGDGTMSAIDAATRRVSTFRVGGSPGGIASGAGIAVSRGVVYVAADR